LRRLWRKPSKIDWKNPVNKWKLLIGVLVGLLVVFGGGYGVLSFTNSSTFCASCHEMAPEYATYTASTHNQISCVQCHIKPGFTNVITHKINSMKEVYRHVTNVPGQIVQTEKEVITNQNCSRCHSKNRLVTASGDLKVNHNGHIEKNIPCITCHSGVVHSKMAARGLNINEYLGYWTKANTKKVIAEKYLRPSMGICIDCHIKVNKGEKPWKDIAYSVPSNPEKVKKENNSLAGVSPTEVAESQDLEKEKGQETQRIVFQTIAKQKTNVKLSMKCKTCHKKINVPNSHKNNDWDFNHGSNIAIKRLEQCLNCHQDSNWINKIQKADIVSLFIMDNQKVKNKTNLINQVRNNQFCSSCHTNYPPSHASGGLWIEGHAWASNNDEDKLKCYVCHNNKKMQIGKIYTKAPSDLYCEYCHKNGFSGILNGRIGD
jgi:nitrate/TMAO reductase-like tetraheme cytochrome c subunit